MIKGMIKDSTLPRRVKNGLAAMGVVYVRDLKERTEMDILRQPNLGRRSFIALRDFMAFQGLSFLNKQGAPEEYMTKKELYIKNARLKKLLGQALERQNNSPVVLSTPDQEYVDQCCNEAMAFAHRRYKHICFNFYYRRDYSL